MQETNRSKNPKTTAQKVQRVLVKAVGMFYAMFKFLCNHSFEGVSNGYKCMNKFNAPAVWSEP